MTYLDIVEGNRDYKRKITIKDQEAESSRLIRIVKEELAEITPEEFEEIKRRFLSL